MDPRCPTCGGKLILGERYQMAPGHRPYADAACKVVYDCSACGRVFEQWLAEGAPVQEVTDAKFLDLRRRHLSRRR